MPREKKIRPGSEKTTALIPSELYVSVNQQLGTIGKEFGLAQAINEGLVLWMVSHVGDEPTKKQLRAILTEWRKKWPLVIQDTPHALTKRKRPSIL